MILTHRSFSSEVFLGFVFAIGVVACARGPAQEPEGQTSAPIIGNSVVDRGDPAVVAFFASADGTSLSSTCTASVIAPRVVLTAAHCLTNPDFTPQAFIVVTAVDALNASAEDQHAVAQVFGHPDYDPDSGENDVALAVLAEPLDVTPLLVNHDSIDGDDGGATRIIGYGQTTSGVATSANTKRAATVAISEITSRHFLVGDDTTTQCHGDSGGPVIMRIHGQVRIVGLSWRTMTNGDCNLGSRATRIDPFAPFIDAFLQSGGVPDGSEDDAVDDSEEPSDTAGGSCGKTINCNDGDCSCGSGANVGRSCDKSSGECDVLCSQC